MSTTHRHRYKNAGLDSSEMRRRREEEGIQIRKQKREQQLTKRRNVVLDNNISNAMASNVDNDAMQVCQRISCLKFFLKRTTSFRIPQKFYFQVIRQNLKLKSLPKPMSNAFSFNIYC